MTIRACAIWRFASRKSYELGRGLFIRTLCRSTMAKYVAGVSYRVGITTLIIVECSALQYMHKNDFRGGFVVTS
jgi:hypothetical protein